MITLQDTKLDIFDLFGNPRSRNKRIDAFLSLYNLCTSSTLKRVPVTEAMDTLSAVLAKYDADEEEEEKQETSAQSHMYSLLQKYGLIRTMTLYDGNEGREVRSACLTGQAQ